MATLRPWHELTQTLADVAMGRRPADMLIRDGRWVNTYTRELIPKTDVAIVAGRIAAVGSGLDYCVGAETEVVEAAGRCLVPGLLDAHMHVESSMLSVTEYARAVIPHGTTAVFADPHEMANVFGMAGVELMLAEARQQPIAFYLQLPSCVPSAPGLERAGATITPSEIEAALGWEGIIGLGEMMNFPGVVAGDHAPHAMIAATMRAGKTVGGHYASPDLGRAFHAYVASGPADDHENTRQQDAIARARRGMRPMLRFGSAWYDVEAQIPAITAPGANGRSALDSRSAIDSRSFILCTDDAHAATLVDEGHMDRVLRHAIDCGCDPLMAIQLATLNPAQHFGLERELGSITPGRRADILLVPDLAEFRVETVFARGQLLAEDGELSVELPAFTHPPRFLTSVNVGRLPSAAALEIAASGESCCVNVIGVIENQAPTEHRTARLPVRAGRIQLDEAQDIARLSLIERHHGSGDVVNAFVGGFGLRGNCAIASSIAHDCHHLIVMGTDTAAMAAAIARLVEIGGGALVLQGGEERALSERALIPLPLGGLMSLEPAAVVAAQSAALIEAMANCGCHLNNAFMQFSLLALAVIPELRITDRGLLDVTRFEHIPLLAAGN